MIWNVGESITIWLGQGKAGNFFVQSLKIRESQGSIFSIFYCELSEALFLHSLYSRSPKFYYLSSPCLRLVFYFISNTKISLVCRVIFLLVRKHCGKQGE